MKNTKTQKQIHTNYNPNMDIALFWGLETKRSLMTVVKTKKDEEKKRPIESEQSKDKEIENLGFSRILGCLGGENWANNKIWETNYF